MHSPLVTIVTPSYNQGRFIRATIESVLSQDYPHIEYIIMDGGSTDETAEIVKEYASRLTWISEKDRGQSHAINKGFRMAKGEIVAWLNSDDLYLPGAVSTAVRRFEQGPGLGAVYGEGYQIDVDGKVKQRFPVTEPFNLWKLVYLSDYILQQTVFFRKAALDEVGEIDEKLNWGMDWDILIRLGKSFQLGYIPEFMGCLREYGDAKSFSGGRRRFRELARLLRRHTQMRFPPGYLTYGIDTYARVWCGWIERVTPRPLTRPSAWFQTRLRGVLHYILAHTVREAQGWYTDGWATTTARFMMPPGNGQLRLRGSLPRIGDALAGQVIRVECNGVVRDVPIDFGEFDFTVNTRTGELLNITLRAKRFVVPKPPGRVQDRRRLAYQLKSIEWDDRIER